MNQWPFVFASYAIVLFATAVAIVSSFVSMRNAERKAEQLSKRK